jgi:hypothetical protein
MTYAELKEVLKAYRDAGHTLEVRLNAKAEVLQAEVERIEALINVTENQEVVEMVEVVENPELSSEIETEVSEEVIEELNFETEPDVTEFCNLVDSITYDEPLTEEIQTSEGLRHEDLGIWVCFILVTLYQFISPIVQLAAIATWRFLKRQLLELWKRGLEKIKPHLIMDFLYKDLILISRV